MQQFFVLYLAPASVLDAWMLKPESERQKEEDAMKASWDQWMEENGAALKQTAGIGRPQRVTQDGVVASRNDIMLFSLLEAESLESATQMFENHPHLQIPESSIEIMPLNVLPGQQG